MFFVEPKPNIRECVANCDSVGLFYDKINNICVGCHPACATCFGPENEECFECNPGFLQIDNNTCDTECSPENSYVIDEICYCKLILMITLYSV